MLKKLIAITVTISVLFMFSAYKPKGTLEQDYSKMYNDAVILAKAIYGEGNGLSLLEKSCIAWCAYNCADCYGMEIEELVRPRYYLGYSESNPVTEENFRISYDVALGHWIEEQYGTCPNRTLPKEYKYFGGHDGHNWFRVDYDGFYNFWDYSLPNPYKKGLPEYVEYVGQSY